MFKLQFRMNDKEIDIRFPISEHDLLEKLTDGIASSDGVAPQSLPVIGATLPEEFSVLIGKSVDLDELNYLARRMDSFDALELDQFLIGISTLDDPSVKDLINLTFNLDHFTLVKDIGNYGKIGRAYAINTEGALPADDEDDPKYAILGEKLIDRGLAQITSKGLLIHDPFDKLDEVYDGRTFPEYYYKDSLACADVSYGGRTELLLLPEEELAIKKAIARLGAPSEGDCQFNFTFNHIENAAWEGRMNNIIRNEGIYEANELLRALEVDNMNWDKLSAIAEIADAQSASQILSLAEHLDEFDFIPNVSDAEELAHHLVDFEEEYSINPIMEDYFDFSGFGEQFVEEHGGQFANGGFLYCSGYDSIDEFLEDIETEDESMTMEEM